MRSSGSQASFYLVVVAFLLAPFVAMALSAAGALAGHSSTSPTKALTPGTSEGSSSEATRATAIRLLHLMLFAPQLIIAWFVGPVVVRYIPGMGRLSLFVFALVFAILVWLIGLLLSWVLSRALLGFELPSGGTLVIALIAALIGAALVTWLPVFVPDVRGAMRALPDLAYPLIGAVLGYHIKR
jgi:hypothetical protein